MKRNHTIRSHRTLWATTLILLLGAVLRLAAFQEALVGADQSSILATAAEVAALRDLPPVGIKSSVGVMQTAVTGYLAAIPFFVMQRVIAIKWFFSALDILALALLTNATTRAFGRRAGLVAALLYATNPWVIEFNRWIWYQSLIPTFATGAFSGFLLAITGQRSGQQGTLALALVSACLMGMVHLAPAPWAALLFALGLVIAWRQRWWRGFLVGIGLSLLIAAPYLSFLARTNFADVTTILRGSAGEAEATWNWAAYRLTNELLTGRAVLMTPRDPLWGERVRHLDALYAVVPLLLAASILDGVIRLVTHGRRARRLPWLFTVGWTVLSTSLFVRSSIHLQHFYLLFVFPAPYVLIGATIEGESRRRGAPAARAAIGALRAVALASVVLLAGWWTHLWLVRIDFEQRGQLRAPTRAWLMDATVATIGAYLEQDVDRQVIIVADFDGGEASPFDWMRNALHSDRVRVTPTGSGLIIPAGPTCYLLAPGAVEADLAPLAELNLTLQVSTPSGAAPWPLRCTPARPPLPPAQAAWQNGLRLITARVEGTLAPSAKMGLIYTWHYRPTAREEYHLFNHLMREGALVTQIDGAGIPTRYWRDDDVLVTHFTLQLPETLPPGDYHLLTGAYTWPEVDRVFLQDGAPAFEVAVWKADDG